MGQQRKLTKQERRARRDLMQSKNPPPPKLKRNSMTEHTPYTVGGSGDGPYDIIHGNKSVAILRNTTLEFVWQVVNCLNTQPGILKELEYSVDALVTARDAITDLIDSKPEKWANYVKLTDAMRIPQINQLLKKAAVAKAKP